jgi:hypothetical protein
VQTRPTEESASVAEAMDEEMAAESLTRM